MARAKNLQALTEDIRDRHPGVVIYGIGDLAHKLNASDHNEDDTSGSKAAQSDKDNDPEHRAIDVMLGPAFGKAQAYQLIDDLLSDPAARARLYYIIFDGWIWSRSNNWKKKEFTRDPHRGHVHISGLAADDENASSWPVVTKRGGVSQLFCKLNDQGENVRMLQLRLRNLGYDPGTVDSRYGPKVSAALLAACKKAYAKYDGNGQTYDADEMIYLDVLWAKKYSPQPVDLKTVNSQLSNHSSRLEDLEKRPAGSLPSSIDVTGRLTIT